MKRYLSTIISQSLSFTLKVEFPVLTISKTYLIKLCSSVFHISTLKTTGPSTKKKYLLMFFNLLNCKSLRRFIF